MAVVNKSQRTTLATITNKAIAAAGVTVLDTQISNRVAFGEAIATGKGVVTYAPAQLLGQLSDS